MNIVIVSVTSDIGFDLGLRWSKMGNSVIGTYRTQSDSVQALNTRNIQTIFCDLSDRSSIVHFADRIERWDVLVVCPGTLEPVGTFAQTDFREWRRSIEVNFVSQVEIVHTLLNSRSNSLEHGPVVIFFAGGGTNGAPVNYSAYTVSKIALIKMTELLHAEVSDTRFTIIGPGWVNTKIHNETLRAGGNAGSNYDITLEKLKHASQMTPLEKIFDCCNWIIGSPRNIVSGRNFSVVHDNWGQDQLDVELARDVDMYKLRRYKN